MVYGSSIRHTTVHRHSKLLDSLKCSNSRILYTRWHVDMHTRRSLSNDGSTFNADLIALITISAVLVLLTMVTCLIRPDASTEPTIVRPVDGRFQWPSQQVHPDNSEPEQERSEGSERTVRCQRVTWVNPHEVCDICNPRREV